MEIIYAYVGKFKNIEEQGFNFSSRFWVDFNPSSKELIIEEREDYIPNFFGDRISNVTAIVGKNGAGKSNLLEFLVNHIARGTRYGWKNEALLVYCKNEKLFYKTNMDVEDSHVQYLGNHEIEREERLIGEVAYYSYSFDNELRTFQDRYNQDITDLSTNQRARITGHSAQLYPNFEFLSFRAKEVRSAAIFFGSVEGSYINDLGIRVPDFLQISVHWEYLLDKAVEVFQRDGGKPKEMQRVLKSIKDRLLEREKDKIRHFRFALFCAVVYDGIGMITNERPIRYLIDLDSRLARGEEISNQDLFNIPMLELGFFIDARAIIELLDFIQQNENHISELNIITFPTKLVSKVTEFFKKVNEVGFKNLDPFNYDWYFNRAYSLGGLSSGEKSFLSLIGRFYEAREKILPGYVIFLDEPEIGFHPQWQKQYLKALLKFFQNENFIANQFQVHIILTAHSPFLISDLPKENVLFLDKDESGLCKVVPGVNQEKTLAANIHTLLTDSFFIQDGIIGDFVSEKIRNLIKDIKEWDNESNALLLPRDKSERKKLIKALIDKIGEPIIHQKLLELYDRYIQRESMEERISRLEEELKRLRDQSN